MSSTHLTALKTMLLTGIILLPPAAPAAAPPAVQDLADLKTVIDSTAAVIAAAPNNSSWGFFSPGSPAGALGTADLIANISTTILRAKYLLDVDKTAWITIPPDTTPSPSPTDPSLPADSQVPTPPATPDTSPNTTLSSLDVPYSDYIASIPTLANALVTLGRVWHKELNAPVSAAIDALEKAINTFSTSMLEANLLNSSSILHTIRASNTLESSEGAWSRLLNLPGKAGEAKRGEIGMMRPPLRTGEVYSHKDLWGRAEHGMRNGGDVKAVGHGGEKVPRLFVS